MMVDGPSNARGRPLILLVDDSTDSRWMYAEYLTAEGYSVVEADNGADALAIARRDLPDVVVMDVGLPQLDGIEATRRLRAEPATEHVLVVALSGHGDAVAKSAEEAGVNRYLRKPCLPNELALHIGVLLGARRSGAAR